VGTLPNGQNILAFQPAYNTALYKVGNYFIRDSHQFGDRWYGVINAWFKGSNVTNKNTFDPRASVQYRPDSSDVLRLTYGRSDGIPAPLLKSTAPVFAPNPGTSLTSVTCIPGSNGVASGGNPNLISESANDYEFGYGHRFGADSDVQVNAYVTSVANELFGATQPLLDYGLSNVTFGAGTLDLYLSRLIAQGCLPAGSTITSVYPFLGVSTTYNAANELARGIELNGRQHLTPNLYLDYGWSVESSQQFNIPNSILSNNVTLINGTQQAGIPLHQANISVDLQQAGFEFRLDNYWVDANNPIDRPGYITSNFFITHPMENNRLLLSLGGTNIFNQAVQYYGLIGEGQPVAVNSFAPSAPFTGIGQNLAGISSNERYGLQPAQLVFTLTAKM
ncbi:MAG: TonB-dependent receptor, partial [Candidatus Eremiobacteraeota bacterium]|nr:TonB-dependent receptor [Candidatus Eremiobacteraeota bacterium]